MSESGEVVSVSARDGIETWRMCAAPVNALNERMISALHAQLERAVADQGVSAIVLTSALKLFSAGGDARFMGEQLREHGPDGLVDRFNDAMDRFRSLCVAIHNSPVLVIAALNGHTLAGGLELAAACDLRFVADSEKLQIGVPEMDLFGAMPSGGGGSQFIARLMGPSRALLFILDGKPVPPREALARGLVDRVCEPGKVVDDAEAFAVAVARKAGRTGVSAAKRAIHRGLELPMAGAMVLDHAVHWDNMRRGNFKAGAVDFVAKYG